MQVVWAVYAAGVVVALWRTDAPWPTRAALAALWPIGPIAFVVTVTILVAASLIAFPVVAGVIAVVTGVTAWWLLSG